MLVWIGPGSDSGSGSSTVSAAAPVTPASARARGQAPGWTRAPGDRAPNGSRKRRRSARRAFDATRQQAVPPTAGPIDPSQPWRPDQAATLAAESSCRKPEGSSTSPISGDSAATRPASIPSANGRPLHSSHRFSVAPDFARTMQRGQGCGARLRDDPRPGGWGFFSACGRSPDPLCLERDGAAGAELQFAVLGEVERHAVVAVTYDEVPCDIER